jgi:hypothetical protein
MTFPDYSYCTLEDPDIRKFASQDPRSFLKKYNKNTIFDEIQRVPESGYLGQPTNYDKNQTNNSTRNNHKFD